MLFRSGIAELLTALVNKYTEDDLLLTDPSTQDEAAASNAKKNAMGRLAFGMIHTEGELELLKHSIPNVYGLREVSVKLGHDLDQYKEQLVAAFKINLTLEKCTVDDEEFLLKSPSSRQSRKLTVDNSEPDKEQPEDGENQLHGLNRVTDDEVESSSSDDGEEHSPQSESCDGDDDLHNQDARIQGQEHASGVVEYVSGSEHDELNDGSSKQEE